ncbi:uncharacterized protein FMAN_05351 [Fusarium mangiferae]|uniref:Uncharacterized protein n=1 Tax=Fusarium mangiferae TaxID=192010 RepID=A0A1L7SQ30_FUSMA|nr:uncharacterized protein FMAN_05351 [Fusarium mangiferae]CVK87799.1 uncharacterized protein FMAN_05351 [Fusarium mangiferae]
MSPKQPCSDEHYNAPYETRHGVEAIIDTIVELLPHEILHHLRGFLEQNHRLAIHTQHYNSFDVKEIRDLDKHQALRFRNKTVLIYVLKGGGIGGLWELVLHNYLYRRWFQPYLSDIDHGECIAMVMKPIDQPRTSNDHDAVSHVLDVHSMINRRLDSIEHETPPFYTTRPLFRAFFIAIPGRNWGGCAALENIASLKVLIVLTGETKGLSAPISFASIADKSKARTLNGLEAVETNLETAVDFLMELEHREEDVFGLQPDPVAASRGMCPFTQEPLHEWVQDRARRLGWKGGEIVGPSSRWVDMNMYIAWTGFGAQVDAVMMNNRVRVMWDWHRRNCRCDKEWVFVDEDTSQDKSRVTSA